MFFVMPFAPSIQNTPSVLAWLGIKPEEIENGDPWQRCCSTSGLSRLYSSTAVFGAAVESAEHLEKRTQPKGIDVSSHQGDGNWNTVIANGVSFAFIKATEGTSEGDSALVDVDI